MTRNTYGMAEGSSVEELSTYNPEALGTAELEAGEPEQRWEDYALELVPVRLNGSDTNRRLILRNGEFIADVSDRYRLLPNERMVEAADEVAERLGAVPFDQFGGDWYIELDDHVFMDDEGRRAHALYAWDDPADVGDGDTIQYGFGVHNSIDGSTGFSVGLFTFRHACANMVMMGRTREGMSFDQRDVLTHSSHRHTHGLDVDNLEAWVEQTLTLADDVHETYSAWREQVLEPADVLELLRRAQAHQLAEDDLPEWAARAMNEIEEREETVRKAIENDQISENSRAIFENGLPEQARAQIVEAEMPQGETVWNTYNSLTEAIWHNPDTNDQSKRRKMKATHRVFPPARNVA